MYIRYRVCTLLSLCSEFFERGEKKKKVVPVLYSTYETK